MKKLIGLVFALVYLIASSSLVHASTMGILDMPHHSAHTVSHCHQDAPPAPDKQSTHNMNCCELFSSNQYSQVSLEFKTSIKNFQHTDPQIFVTRYPFTVSHSPLLIGSSPGGQTSLNKYNKFSDLSSGIIVSLS